MSINYLSEKAKPFYITQAQIASTHPITSDDNSHPHYDAARILVGERHAKSTLVNLVGHLIYELDKARAAKPSEGSGDDRIAKLTRYDFRAPNGVSDFGTDPAGEYVKFDDVSAALAQPAEPVGGEYDSRESFVSWHRKVARSYPDAWAGWKAGVAYARAERSAK
jgi:hypothetical protein